MKWCNKNEWMMFLFLVMIVMRLPSLFAPHHYGDEEIYFVMGRAWKTGEGLYQQAFDHKPPLIYIVAGIAESVFWFRTILLGWMLVHTYLFFEVAKVLWGNLRPKMAYLSSFVFVILTSLPMIEGNIANAELFMMMPITASLLILLKARDNSWRKLLVAGVVAGIGLLFKIPVVFDMIGILLFFLLYEKRSWRQIFVVGLGFVLPLLFSIIYYQLKGVGADYIRAAITVNFGYVSAWATSSSQFEPLKSGLVIRGLILAGYVASLYFFRKKLGREYVLALSWLAFSTFGALLSGRPYPHYLQQPVVPLALFLPFLFVIDKTIKWIVVGVSIILAIVIQKQIGFWWYPNVKIYQDFWQYVTGRIDEVEYRNSFDSAKRNYAVADYLRERLGDDDQIYLWGYDVAIYNLTNKKLVGGKYMVDFHVRDWQAFSLVMKELERNKPKYIIMLPGAVKFEELEAMIAREYLFVATIEEVMIWQRI